LHPDVVVRIIERVGREVGFVGADLMEVAPMLERHRNQKGQSPTMTTALRYLDATFAGLNRAHPARTAAR
jgi:agmatinase